MCGDGKKLVLHYGRCASVAGAVGTGVATDFARGYYDDRLGRGRDDSLDSRFLHGCHGGVDDADGCSLFGRVAVGRAGHPRVGVGYGAAGCVGVSVDKECVCAEKCGENHQKHQGGSARAAIVSVVTHSFMWINEWSVGLRGSRFVWQNYEKSLLRQNGKAPLVVRMTGSAGVF